MKHRFVVLLACAACLGMSATRAAQCEPVRYGPTVAGLPASEILTIVRSTGFEPTGRLVRRPGIFVVRALDPHKRGVDLTLDARTGRVLAVRPVTGAPPAPVYAAPSPRRGADYPRRGLVFGLAARPFDDPSGFEDAAGALPPPPGAIPSARSPLPNATRSAAVLPLPRPRPTAPEPLPQPPPPPVAIAPAATMPPVAPLE